MGPWETCHLNAAGIGDYLTRYGKGIFDVSSDFRPLARIEGAAVDRIEQEMNERIPLDSIDQRKKWRDERLKAISQLKKQLDH
jgi:L-gulonate 3-dehydrogenase